MSLPEQGLERLVELAGRRALGAQATFLANVLPLDVKLAHDRVGHTVRFQPEEQLQLVRREPHEVQGHVQGRARVEGRPAVTRVDRVQLVVHHQGPLGFEQFVVLLLHLGVLGRPLVRVEHVADFAAALHEPHAVHFLYHFGPQRVLPLDEGALGLVVARADDPGAFEHHVLEHVGDAAAPARIVHRSHVVKQPRTHRRLLVTLHQQQFEPVVQHLHTGLYALPPCRTGAEHARHQPGERHSAAASATSMSHIVLLMSFSDRSQRHMRPGGQVSSLDSFIRPHHV